MTATPSNVLLACQNCFSWVFLASTFSSRSSTHRMFLVYTWHLVLMCGQLESATLSVLLIPTIILCCYHLAARIAGQNGFFRKGQKTLYCTTSDKLCFQIYFYTGRVITTFDSRPYGHWTIMTCSLCMVTTAVQSEMIVS